MREIPIYRVGVQSGSSLLRKAYREAEIMELGKRLKAARLEAGLSQRQLCGEVITRNMLSQIENGAARPSMDTLLYLADRLGKPVAYFLDEDPVVTPNRGIMERARQDRKSVV